MKFFNEQKTVQQLVNENDKIIKKITEPKYYTYEVDSKRLSSCEINASQKQNKVSFHPDCDKQLSYKDLFLKQQAKKPVQIDTTGEDVANRIEINTLITGFQK